MEINGIRYQGFTSANVTKSMINVADSFIFQSTSDVVNLQDIYPILNISEVDIYIDTNKILTGHVDVINPYWDNDRHSIESMGRSKTAILVDSSVWETRTFNRPAIFAAIANKVVSDLGADIRVINKFGIIKIFDKEISAHPGEKAFEFLERLARERQILLTTDVFGNLVLTRSSTDRIDTILLHQKRNLENNVLGGAMSYDFTKRYREYKILGQSTPGSFFSSESQASINGHATDKDALEFKKLAMVADQEMDLETSNNYAKWESNIRRANSQSYNCRVQGHYHKDGLWDTNVLTRVVDEYSALDTDMLIKEITFLESSHGSFTDMILVPPDAFTLELERSLFDTKKDDIGDGFYAIT